ncbi:hypothetical protein BE61_28510 [Bradyrhizobium elkanii USDA 61]|nr:hypothetical protein BE61_28510 [Bradyrhizobium elkanii USDA 61]
MGRKSYALILPGIMPEKTGDPGRPSLSAPAPLSLEYWITRMRGDDTGIASRPALRRNNQNETAR